MEIQGFLESFVSITKVLCLELSVLELIHVSLFMKMTFSLLNQDSVMTTLQQHYAL